MLGHFYRFTVLNSLGQNITATSVVLVKLRRWKWASDGSITWDTEATVLDHTTTDINNATYFDGTSTDNSSNKYVGAVVFFDVTAPASSNGSISLFIKRSTDGGTTYDDDATAMFVTALDFTTSGQKRTHALIG